MPADTLVIMLKEPNFGRVKTRLAADIGTLEAVWWYRHQTRRLIRRLDAPSRWHMVLAVAPDYAGMRSRVWPRHLQRIPQGCGSLGERMRNVFQQLPNRRVVLIGSDVPDISQIDIAAAFKATGIKRMAIGPAPDGGYWGISLGYNTRNLPNRFLRNVRWSSCFAMADTIASLKGDKISKLATLQDIDRACDLSPKLLGNNNLGSAGRSR